MVSIIESNCKETSSKSVLENDTIICGDSLAVLKTLPDASFDLIFTSPPYADNRKKTYKGVPTKHYVEWFLPISCELKRVLKPKGLLVQIG